VSYESDPAKARANLSKHGVDSTDAATALEDDRALTIRDPFSSDEERWITIGRAALGSLLVVVYPWREESVRLISARFARHARSGSTRKAYET
jgi:uncharacterized DUF497 family protein